MANFARQMQQSCWSGRVRTIAPGSRHATSNSLLGLLLGRPHRSRLHTSTASSTQQQGSATAMEHKHTNRLAKEQSPYLLQHAHNPVDWYPWGDEAIQAAKDQDKPIFLSVGYATCHWCHVMEHESFESEETAAIMNKNFINIKVDREERPDVDRVYMTFVQATTGGGGWPMSVWLTPDLKPFYGGTYYPGKDQYGMPSFSTVLKRIAQLWGTKREDLQEQGNTVMEQLQEFTAPDSPTAGIGSGVDPVSLTAAVSSCAASLAKGFDKKQGGFGPAPKFPRPSEINVMLRAASQAQGSQPSTSSKKAAPPSASLLLGMSLFSLQAMAAGGMYDQLGGGFHRYSVDEFWHVPHFEKMLYDNPQLALTYLDAFRITLAKQRGSGSGSTPAAAAAADAGAALASPVAGSGSSSGASGGSGVSTSDEVLYDPRVYATVVRGVLDYLGRDMTHPEGGLYSAEDADSLDTETNKKSEGAFYVWTYDEIVEVLGQERASVFCEVYGVKPAGNCTLSARSDPHREFVGKNVLAEFKRLSEAESVSSAGLPLTRAEELLGSCRQELFQRRAARPRPALDDKIVTAWNGQGISAFALAARILPAEQPPAGPCFPVEGCSPQTYMQAAVSIAEFVQRHMWDPQTKRLRRAYCKAPSSVEGFADDYALLIAGLLDLYESGGGLKWLQWAVQLQDTLDSLFWDQSGGYFQTSGTDASVLLRLKEDYDGAEPAASSVAALNLMRLAALLPEGGSGSSSSGGGSVMSYGARVDAVLNAFSTRLQQVPMAMPQMCVAAWLKTKTPLRQVIISGPASHKSTESLLNAAHAAWAHDKAVILVDPTDTDSVGFWKQHNPEAWAMVDAHYSKQGRTSGSAAAAAAPAGSTEAAAAAAEVSDMGLKPAADAAGAAAGSDGDDAGFPPTAFVCQNFTCQAPTGDAGKVYELLSRQGTPVVKLQPVKL